MENNKHLVAVYGSLRQGFGNHRLLVGSKFLGDDDIYGGYKMYSLWGYPGVIKADGNHRIKIEVYEVDDMTLQSLDRLEGFRGSQYKDNLYNRESINTKYGSTFIYFLNDYYGNEENLVENGDWSEYLKTKYSHESNN